MKQATRKRMEHKRFIFGDAAVASMERRIEQLQKAKQYLESRYETDELKYAIKTLTMEIQNTLRKIARNEINKAAGK